MDNAGLAKCTCNGCHAHGKTTPVTMATRRRHLRHNGPALSAAQFAPPASCETAHMPEVKPKEETPWGRSRKELCEEINIEGSRTADAKATLEKQKQDRIDLKAAGKPMSLE